MHAKLEIESTEESPYILMDKENNKFEIKGNSLPENTNKFFEPVFNWLEQYISSPNEETHLKCDLEYFNSSSAKIFYFLFLEFAKISKTKKKVQISWLFDSGDALIEEKGLDYKSILKIPFEVIEK